MEYGGQRPAAGDLRLALFAVVVLVLLARGCDLPIEASTWWWWRSSYLLCADDGGWQPAPAAGHRRRNVVAGSASFPYRMQVDSRAAWSDLI